MRGTRPTKSATEPVHRRALTNRAHQARDVLYINGRGGSLSFGQASSNGVFSPCCSLSNYRDDISVGTGQNNKSENRKPTAHGPCHFTIHPGFARRAVGFKAKPGSAG